MVKLSFCQHDALSPFTLLLRLPQYAVTLAERTLEEGHTDLAAWFDLASATSTLITHLTSQLKELFMTLHLPDKLPVAVEWCIQQVKGRGREPAAMPLLAPALEGLHALMNRNGVACMPGPATQDVWPKYCILNLPSPFVLGIGCRRHRRLAGRQARHRTGVSPLAAPDQARQAGRRTRVGRLVVVRRGRWSLDLS